jgi:hypothetical protein
MPAIIAFRSISGMIVVSLTASILLLHISTIGAYTSRY